MSQTVVFVKKMTFKHLPPTQRNQATRRRPSCLAVDPGRCEFWRVQKNSAWGHHHLHNPPDISPRSLIKLFTSLAPNYVDHTKHSLSITGLPALIISEQPMSLFPLECTADKANKAQLRLTDKDFTAAASFPTCPLCLAFHFVLRWFKLLKNRPHLENCIAVEAQTLKTMGHQSIARTFKWPL